MKKWALPLSLAVAVAAGSATASAATDPIATNFRGHFKSQLQYNSSDVNKDIINGVHDPDNPDNRSYHLPTGAFGAVDVDLRGDIVLSPNAQNRFVLELRHRIRGDKLLDSFPTRFNSAHGVSSNNGAFGGGANGNIFGADNELNPTDKLIDKAYLENKSAWWEGGPEITTRLGRQDPNWNPWVARFNRFDRTGVTIEGFKLGPASLNIGYIWSGSSGKAPLERVGVLRPGQEISNSTPGAANGINSAVVTAKIPVESAELDLAAVRTAARGRKAIFDYAAGLRVPLSSSVDLSGAYARDGLRENSAYNVKLATKLGAANLSAMYRSVDEGFQPVFESREDLMNPEKRTESNVHDERTGFKIAADGQIHNWHLSGSFDSSYRSWLGYTKDEKIDTVELGAKTKFNTVDFSAGAKIEKSKETRDAYVDEYLTYRNKRVIYREDKKNDKNTYTVGLGTNFDIVRATYELKLTDEKKSDGPEKRTIHTIGLSAPLKVAYLDTLHVGANVALRSGDLKGRASTGWGVDLAWQGRNGLRFGVHYTKGYNGELKERLFTDTEGTVLVKTAEPDELRKYVYPDGTTHYLGNGLAVTAGYGISF